MEYQVLIEEIKKAILPILEENAVDLVDLSLIRGYAKPTLRLLVDKKESGISLGECARLNEEIGAILDEKNTIEGGYILEVSSPGLDRSLKTKGDFLHCINRKVVFFLKEPINARLEARGTVVSVGENDVDIEIEGSIVKIPLAGISKAKQEF